MKAIIALTLLLCTGCAEFSAVVNTYGSEAAAQNLTVSRYAHCVASPIGAVYKEYDTPEKIRAYNDFCGYSNLMYNWPYEIGPEQE